MRDARSTPFASGPVTYMLTTPPRLAGLAAIIALALALGGCHATSPATPDKAAAADPANVDNLTIRDSAGNVALVLESGRRDRVPVHKGAVVNPVTGTGDYHRLSQWTVQGVGAGEKVYVDAR